MDNSSKKNILIIGSGALAYTTGRRFAKSDFVGKVYITGKSCISCDFAEYIDIREDDTNELLIFAVKNDVDLTVVTSAKAIKADVVGVFQANSQDIFAPSLDSASIAISRSVAKRCLYKLHIPTPKFGIFEKNSLAVDYVKKAQMPLLISSDEVDDSSVICAVSTVNLAKKCLDDMSINGEEKYVIEDLVQGHSFTYYVITDGYHVLPLGICADYKFLEDGDGGLYTCGSGAYSPNYKVSSEIKDKLLAAAKNVVSALENKQTPYLGILGLECVLRDNETYFVTNFVPFLKDHDAQVIFNLLEDDIYTLFKACTIGAFADDYVSLRFNDLSSVSLVLFARNDGHVISGLDLVDENTDVSFFTNRVNDYMEIETNKGRTLVLTQKGATLSSARRLLYENVDVISFNGKKFRSDICN